MTGYRAWSPPVCLVASLMGCGGGNQAPTHLEFVRVERREMPSEIAATGTVRPQVGAEVNVGARISGVLKKLSVRVGDHVHAGQLLAALDHTDLDVSIRAAEATLALARAQQRLAARHLQRYDALSRDGLISEDEWETARSAAAVADAESDHARTQVETARIQRSYAEILAPMAGTVTSIGTRQGEAVAASFAVPTFVTIMDLNRLQVEAYVDEVDIGRVAAGQHAVFAVDAFPQESFDAAVDAVIPQAKMRDNVVSYTVVLSIARGKKELLRPDMTAAVSISTGLHKGALVLPLRAVQHDAEGRPYVLIRAAGKLSHQEVSVAEIRGDEIRIRAGLSEGDEVVVPSTEGGRH